MASTVTQIIAQIKAIAAGELGLSWTELPHVLDLTKNDERRSRKGYGARPLAASDAQSTTSTYALDHVFELVLMMAVPKNDDDSQAMAVIGTLYDMQDEILRRAIRQKMNMPFSILMVSNPALSEPEFVNDRQFVALRQQFNVRYRQTI
jgi:hypothetical protein